MGLSSVAFRPSECGLPDLAAMRLHTGRLRRRTLDGLITAKPATAPNVFISLDGGSGEDAIAVNQMNGNNVLNGSAGSSFLYGGAGKDTFFVDESACR
jgi:RTX calcium-binding nonapeptide repeat (4 copies)